MPAWLLALDRHFPIRYLAWLACAVAMLLGAFTWVAFDVGGAFALLGALGVVFGDNWGVECLDTSCDEVLEILGGERI